MHGLLVLFTLLLLPFNETLARSSVDDPILKGLAPSVVRIEVDDGRIATGFVWNDPATVVTAYHVVVGAQSIGVRFSQLEGAGFSIAHIEAVAPEFDLALLKLSRPKRVTPLLVSKPVQPETQQWTVVGHPLKSRELQSHPLYKRRIAPRELKGLLVDKLPSSLQKYIEEYGSADPFFNQEVMAVGGGLMPGYSGAPVFDVRGMVIGIGHGGLGEGTLDWGWIIPASRLSLAAFRPQKPSDSQYENLFKIFYGASGHLEEYEFNKVSATASMVIYLDIEDAVFAKYHQRVSELYRRAKWDKKLQNLARGNSPLVENGIFPITQNSPLAFRTNPKDHSNEEYLNLALIASLEFYVKCYSESELRKVILGEDKNGPDINFRIRSDYNSQPASTTQLRYNPSKRQIAILITDEKIGRDISIKPGHENAAMMFGGACEVSPEFVLPRSTPNSIWEDTRVLLERSTFSLEIKPNTEAELRPRISALAILGDLRTGRTAHFAYFPESPRSN